jgi:diacylglycerol kinase family enzyme
MSGDLSVAAPATTPRRGTRTDVVANPLKVARPDAVRAELTRCLAARGWPPPSWSETTREDPGSGQAAESVRSGADVVLAAGGDGTVRACADALAGTAKALAVLPFGTGNLLARNLGLPSGIADVVTLVTSGRRRRLDVGVLDGRCFTVMAGMGLDAHMLHDAPEALKRRIGWPAYLVAAARHLCEPPMTLTMRIDGGPPLTRRARMLLIGNVGRLQGGIRVFPQARPDDGLLELAVLMPPRRRSLIPLGWSLLRRRPTPPLMDVFRALEIQVSSDRPHLRELDGDLMTAADALTATIRPGALWVCAPEPRP